MDRKRLIWFSLRHRGIKASKEIRSGAQTPNQFRYRIIGAVGPIEPATFGREYGALAITADIEDLAVTEFMMMLAHSQKTGQLTIERGDDRVKLAFNDGAIVYAASTGVRETVGAMLVRRELIDDDQLQEALQRQQRTEEVALLGQILVEMEAVEIEDLIQVVYLQFQNVVREALAWSEGHAEFISMDIQDLGNVRVDPREIILEEGIVTERLLLGGAVGSMTRSTDHVSEQTDQPDGLRATLSDMRENSLVITAEMAAAILGGAQDLVHRGVLFAVLRGCARHRRRVRGRWWQLLA